MASVDKLGKLFDLPVEPIGKLQLARVPGAHEVALVDLKLNPNAEVAANIAFEAGQAHAIYCPTELQRGKLMDVLVGQGKPGSGHVLINDYRVDAIAAESLQETISLVRDIELFVGTVDDNLRMGRENIGSADVNDVVNRLGFRKTLVSLPEGFATKVNISGFPLSRGQAIRLVIARALIAKPGILFVDGLIDRLSDEDIEDLLPRLSSFVGQTTIVIATGRQRVARWAEHCLDMRHEPWRLAEFKE
jgi:putative ABC transport system ATP-binding protein